MKDITIIGAGTAGLTAAIYALRSGKSVLIIESTAYGGQIINTPEIDNYPGLLHVSGYEFATKLYEQAVFFGAEIVYETAVSIEDNAGKKTVVTSKGNRYESSAVIIATGAKHRPLGLENEQSFIGKGVSYCAACDGMFFKKKDAAVVGGGNTAVSDALFLSQYCNKVYFIHRRHELRADAAETEKLKQKENVEFILESNVTKLIGDKRLSAIEVTNKNDNSKGEIEVRGLFIAIGQMPDNNAFSNIVKLDEQGYICADESCETGVSGIYTAGDCRTKQIRQLTTAASDGTIAALTACNWI